MLTAYPDYYPKFRCIAGACRHSCCIGWEIDIDEESLAKYQNLPDPLGQRLRDNIVPGDPPHFLLGEGERCPFLNQDNLCDLILAGGEGLLCQICDDHPRFRNFLPGRTEIGLGLCCEGAAALILSQTHPVTLVTQGEMEETDPDAKALLALRQQAFDEVQDRSLSIDARCDRLLRLCGACEPGHPADWADVLLELERLDDGWTAMVKNLRNREKLPPFPPFPTWNGSSCWCISCIATSSPPGRTAMWAAKPASPCFPCGCCGASRGCIRSWSLPNWRGCTRQRWSIPPKIWTFCSRN